MAQNLLGSEVVCQVAIVVRDVGETARAWAELLGVATPDWHITAPVEESHAEYRGERTEARAKLAFLDLGQVQLELIEPVGAPSTWSEFLDEHGEGLHHVAFRIQGMDEVLDRLARRGIPLIQRGDYTGGRYAYVDGIPRLGAILELLENLTPPG